jgi:hypothetical protein
MRPFFLVMWTKMEPRTRHAGRFFKAFVETQLQQFIRSANDMVHKIFFIGFFSCFICRRRLFTSLWRFCLLQVARLKYYGSGMFTPLPDPNFSIPDSRFMVKKKRSRIRIRIKEFKHFNPKKLFLSSRKNDLECSSWIPDPDLFHPGSGSRI